MRRTIMLAIILSATAMTTGCVHRRVVIDSQPPGALVLRNNQPIGYTPCDDVITYYGKYRYTLVKDGYQTLTEERKLRAPWYEFPGLDFFSENVWPFSVVDVRRLTFTLQPQRIPTFSETLEHGTRLREQGKQIGDAPVLPPAPVPVPTPPPVAQGTGPPRP